MDPSVLRRIVHRAYYDHEALVTGAKPGWTARLGNFGVCLISTYDAAHAGVLTLLFIFTYVASVYKFLHGWQHSTLTDYRLWGDILVILLAWRLVFDLMTTAAHRPFRHVLRFWFLYILVAGALDVVVEGLWWVARKAMRRQLGVFDFVADIYAKKNVIVEPITTTTVLAYTIGKYIVTTIIFVLPYIYTLLKWIVWLKYYLSCLEFVFLAMILHSIYIVLNESIMSGNLFSAEARPVVLLPPVWSRWFVYIAKFPTTTSVSPLDRQEACENFPLIRLTSETTMASPSNKHSDKLSDASNNFASRDIRRRCSQPPGAIYQIIPWYKCFIRILARLIFASCLTSPFTTRIFRCFAYHVQKLMDSGSISVSYTRVDEDRIQILIDRAGDAQSVVRLDGVLLRWPVNSPAAVSINRYTFGGVSYTRRRGAGSLKLIRRYGDCQLVTWSITTVGIYKTAEIMSKVKSDSFGSDVLFLVGDSKHPVQVLCIIAFNILQFTSMKNIICITDGVRLSNVKIQAAHIITVGDGWSALDRNMSNILMIDAKLSARSVWASPVGLACAALTGTNLICHSDSNSFKNEYNRVYGPTSSFECTHSHGRIFTRCGLHVRCNEDGLQELLDDWLKRF